MRVAFTSEIQFLLPAAASGMKVEFIRCLQILKCELETSMRKISMKNWAGPALKHNPR